MLYKTTLVIWSDYDPHHLEIDQIASHAIDGDFYYSKRATVIVNDPRQDKDWDQNDFFYVQESE